MGRGNRSPQAVEEQSSHAFANYREDDFKPPSYEEMEAEMAQLRAQRETFPEMIGKKAFESGLGRRDRGSLDGGRKNERGGKRRRAFGSFLPDSDAPVLAAGITDPSLDEVREEEQEISDRMLNLQMQLRRMGEGAG